MTSKDDSATGSSRSLLGAEAVGPTSSENIYYGEPVFEALPVEVYPEQTSVPILHDTSTMYYNHEREMSAIDSSSSAVGHIRSSPRAVFTAAPTEAEIANSIKRKLVGKIYTAIFIMLVITSAVSAGLYFAALKLIEEFDIPPIYLSLGFIIGGLIAYLIASIVVHCIAHRISHRTAIFFMILISLFMGVAIAGVILISSIKALISGLVATILAFAICTIIAVLIKKNIHVMVMCVIVVVLAQFAWLLYPLMFIWFSKEENKMDIVGLDTFQLLASAKESVHPYNVLHAAIGMIFVVIIGLFLIIDTHFAVKRARFSDWLIAAVNIYSDITTIFIYTVSLFRRC